LALSTALHWTCSLQGNFHLILENQILGLYVTPVLVLVLLQEMILKLFKCNFFQLCCVLLIRFVFWPDPDPGANLTSTKLDPCPDKTITGFYYIYLGTEEGSDL
jgi:hypothetical protein